MVYILTHNLKPIVASYSKSGILEQAIKYLHEQDNKSPFIFDFVEDINFPEDTGPILINPMWSKDGSYFADLGYEIIKIEVVK